MTRKEAEEQAGAFNREHPDRASHRWLAREGADGWEVARVTLPAGFGAQPVGTITQAKPKPPEPDDPRPAYWRNAGGPWVG
ncbi:MAG TPA: hypothetical protein VD836_18765 [Solirubrobacteraceae bacterium]|jgi:hypothetical protein|nr:hypothetical protein [Solirubrobacteraceae bacterium]